MEHTYVCYNCFQKKAAAEGPCPYCGFDLAENEAKYPVALRAGTVLNRRYVVGRVLGQGGFGITYLAWDSQLDAKVAIKEFMPGEIAARLEGSTVSVMSADRSEDFAYGAERFQEEARTLAKFIGNPNIAGVSSYFDENGTSYFVMDYIEGISFKTYIANQGGKVSAEEALNVMIPVLRALTAVHREGFIHRDVTPDNIYITKDGIVKLLDFGSARYSIGDKSKSLDVILKVGYAPKEQYIRRSRQGPYTDVYSCAACFYAALTGFLPPEALERLEHDTLVPVSQCGISIPEYLDRAILKGLAVQPEDRFQSAEEFLEAIETQQVVELRQPETPAVGTAPQPSEEKRSRIRPAFAAGIAAAALALAVGAGIWIGGGSRGTAVPAGGTDQPAAEAGASLDADAPTVTIAGEEYSTALTELRLESMGLTDADILPLSEMTNLTYLDLRENQLTDLTPLSGLTKLEKLELRGNNLSDLTPLSGLTNLTDLRLGGSGSGQDNPNITDLSPLSNLTKLQYLTLPRQAAISDLSALAGMTDLRALRTDGHSGAASEGAVTDLTPLSGLTRLETLQLMTCAAGDLTPLSGLTGLKELRLYGELKFTDLSPLSGLTQLEYLEITPRGNGPFSLTSLQPLSGMEQMEKLEIRSDGTLSLSGLENMKQLKTLYLSGFRDTLACVDLDALSGLTSLTELTLDIDGQVTDLSPLSGLVNLTYLDLYAFDVPALQDLSFLRDMKQLRTLNLAESTLTDISALRDLPALENFSIREYSGSNIADWSPAEHIPNVVRE